MGFSSRLKAHRHLLTLETLKFIVAFLNDDNATAAALQAGIPETYASRQGQWLKKLPIVMRALENEYDDREMRKLATAIEEIEIQMRVCKGILNIEDA
jgi:phage terminase small subunit